MFKTRQLILLVPAALLVFSSGAVAVQQPTVTIQVVTSFDYPGTGNSTTAHNINRRGDIAGTYLDSVGVTRGFIRLANGSFSPPMVEPNDTGNFTFPVGINASRLVCGYYLGAPDFAYHGFFFSGHTYTEYDAPGFTSTFLLDVNDAGDFCGSFNDLSGVREALVDVAGNLVSYVIGTAPVTEANTINNLDQVVGEYFDAPPATTYHGYFRDSNGTLSFPIDYPGATSTILQGINDRGLIVGRWTDSSGIEHGFLLKRPSNFISFDYPGASGTSLNGINNSNLISGRYTDSSGIRHGFLARAH